MKTLKFINGDIEFYASDKLEYDKRYLAHEDESRLMFKDYVGRVGLNNCRLDVKDDANISGVVAMPSLFIIRGQVNLCIPPYMNISVRSLEQGRVNGVLMEPKTRGYAYGKILSYYAKKYFEYMFDYGKFNIDMVGETFVAINEKLEKAKIHSLDLCEKYNLVYIESAGYKKPPLIDIGYSLNDLILVPTEELDRLERDYVSSEEYENAALVLKEKRRRLEKH